MKEVLGDILSPAADGKETIVCQVVDCRGTMGGGLALRIRNTFPPVFQYYQNLCRNAGQPENLLGHYLLCSATGGLSIASLFGLESRGRRQQTSYGHLHQALQDLAKNHPEAVIRIPYRIGCGLGESEWKYMQGILEDAVPNAEIWRLP